MYFQPSAQLEYRVDILPLHTNEEFQEVAFINNIKPGRKAYHLFIYLLLFRTTCAISSVGLHNVL